MDTAALSLDLPPFALPFAPAAPPPEPALRKRWTRDEYHQLGEQGWFHDQQTELIDGEIIVVPPQSHDHFQTIEVVRRILDRLLGENYWVRTQGPLPVDDHNEPEPELSVVAGAPWEHGEHPRSSLLAIEISRTSQDYDKKTKPALYAAAKAPEYWVLDLKARTLTVHVDPVPKQSKKGFACYSSVVVYGETDSVVPQLLPSTKMLLRIF